VSLDGGRLAPRYSIYQILHLMLQVNKATWKKKYFRMHCMHRCMELTGKTEEEKEQVITESKINAELYICARHSKITSSAASICYLRKQTAIIIEENQ
jgi:hypothetical protein